jgi:hypothetical protein
MVTVCLRVGHRESPEPRGTDEAASVDGNSPRRLSSQGLRGGAGEASNSASHPAPAAIQRRHSKSSHRRGDSQFRGDIPEVLACGLPLRSPQR